MLSYQVVKTYRVVEEEFGALLTSALNGFEVQLPVPVALPQVSFAPGIELRYPLGGGWAPVPTWTPRKKENIFPLPVI
jgi:hypothetical protein